MQQAWSGGRLAEDGPAGDDSTLLLTDLPAEIARRDAANGVPGQHPLIDPADAPSSPAPAGVSGSFGPAAAMSTGTFPIQHPGYDDAPDTAGPRHPGHDTDPDGAAQDNADYDAGHDGAGYYEAGYEGAGHGATGYAGTPNDSAGYDGVAHDGVGYDGVARDGVGYDGVARDGVGYDGVARDGVGYDGVIRDGVRYGGAQAGGGGFDGAVSDVPARRRPTPRPGGSGSGGSGSGSGSGGLDGRGPVARGAGPVVQPRTEPGPPDPAYDVDVVDGIVVGEPWPGDNPLPRAATRTAPGPDNTGPVTLPGRDNTGPLSGTAPRVPYDRTQNRGGTRWEGPANASVATRPATRPFTRVPGRHAATSRRQAWETRYVRAIVACDLTVGLAAGALTFAVRFGEQVTTYNRAYMLMSLALPVVLIAVLAFSRAYERRHLYVGTDEYQRVIRGGLGLTATAAVVSYALDLELARSYVLAALPLATVAAVVLRFALRKRLHAQRARGRCLRRVIVVGHELAVVAITRQLRRERYHGLEVVGACLPPVNDGKVNLPVYGTFDDVAFAVDAAGADTVVVLSCPELDGAALRRMAWRLERDEVDLIVASNLVDVAGARTTIRPVDGLPMLHVEHPRLDGGVRVVKEVVDRVGAVILLALLSPLLLVLAVAVRVSSPGPVFFRQIRVGRDGRMFRMVKFRSMYLDAEARLEQLRHLNEHDGLLFKMRDDPRVTPVGRWLRRLSLDELPQLFNVLGGRMSLVGPRPPLPVEVAAYPVDVRRRLAVKPGMTGLWQVSGRSDLSWEEAVRLDLSYVENWSLSLDLVILLRTVSAVVRSSGAY